MDNTASKVSQACGRLRPEGPSEPIGSGTPQQHQGAVARVSQHLCTHLPLFMSISFSSCYHRASLLLPLFYFCLVAAANSELWPTYDSSCSPAQPLNLMNLSLSVHCPILSILPQIIYLEGEFIMSWPLASL